MTFSVKIFSLLYLVQDPLDRKKVHFKITYINVMKIFLMH